MIIEIKYTINGMCLNYPETIPNSLPSDPWKHCLPWTWSLAQKGLGTAILANSIGQYKMQVSFNAVLKNFNAKILCPSLLEDFFQGYSLGRMKEAHPWRLGLYSLWFIVDLGWRETVAKRAQREEVTWSWKEVWSLSRKRFLFFNSKGIITYGHSTFLYVKMTASI